MLPKWFRKKSKPPQLIRLFRQGLPRCVRTNRYSLRFARARSVSFTNFWLLGSSTAVEFISNAEAKNFLASFPFRHVLRSRHGEGGVV